MQERSDIEVECTDLSSRGWGIGREPGGRVVMVDGAIPGDRVLASVTSVMRRWAKARLVRLLRPSDARVRPRCRHFGECGGCSLQQMNPAAQRRVKTARIRQVLARTSGLSA
ncbi:MAG: TRAM domain-containing protein, partial [Acidobacteriota bacterium]